PPGHILRALSQCVCLPIRERRRRREQPTHSQPVLQCHVARRTSLLFLSLPDARRHKFLRRVASPRGHWVSGSTRKGTHGTTLKTGPGGQPASDDRGLGFLPVQQRSISPRWLLEGNGNFPEIECAERPIPPRIMDRRLWIGESFAILPACPG